jgi:predicted transcriptional regulator of viral defense system
MNLTKITDLYNSLLPMKVVTFNEIVQEATNIVEDSYSSKYIYDKYVTQLLKTGRLDAIRKGLYAVLSPLEQDEKYEPDKFLIASKIREDYFLGFHTALEYYGSAYSAFNEVYVCTTSRNRFNPFSYKRFTFKRVEVKDTTSQVLNKHYGKNFLRVSSKERTFIECVDKPQYAGGWEECIKSLENLSGIDEEQLLSLTLKQKGKRLLSRVGYVLELLKKRSPFYEHISDDTLNEIEMKTKGSPKYLVKGQKAALNRRWNLWTPEGFEEKLRDV